jgi:uracil phosphoribosyltransferase
MRFRRNLEAYRRSAAYEISKVLPFVEKEVQTPLGIAKQSAGESASAGNHPESRFAAAPGLAELF